MPSTQICFIAMINDQGKDNEKEWQFKNDKPDFKRIGKEIIPCVQCILHVYQTFLHQYT